MKVSKAKNALNSLPNDDEEVVFALVREAEIKQVTGQYYPDIATLSNLVSRIPSQGNNIEGHFWYDERFTFRDLLVAGMKYLEKTRERDRIMDANFQLVKDMGLKNIALSLPYEVRPMAPFVDNGEVLVRIPQRSKTGAVVLPVGATWADVLREVDDLNEGAGDSRYLESIDFKFDKELDQIYIEAWFGS